MSDTGTDSSNWFDEATAAVKQVYDTTVQAVTETYDSAVNAVQQGYETATQAVQQTYDSATETVQRTYDSAVQTAQDAYDWGEQAVQDAYDWGSHALGDYTVPPVCEDPNETEEPNPGGYVLHLAGDSVLHGVLHLAKSGATGFGGAEALGVLSAGYLIYETVLLFNEAADAADAEYIQRLCGEYYEQLLQQALAGAAPKVYFATCDCDHDGSTWTGPLRMNEQEAADDVNGHVYEWPDHELVDGDATVTPLPGDAYAAGCDADHDGTSWSGPDRHSFDEAADDLVAHLVEWPDHQLDTDDGRPGARVKTHGP